MAQQVEGAAVDVLGGDDVITGLGDVAHRVFHGGCTGGDGKACGTTFKGGDAVLKDTLGGVGQTAVDVARVGKAESGLGMIEVVENVGGGGVDRHCAGIGGRVGLLLAHVQLQGFKTVLFAVLGHGYFSLVMLGREDFSLPPACRVRVVGEVLVMKLRRLGRATQAERYRACL